MQPTYSTSYTFDIETGIPLFWTDVPYDGKWEFAKKGRESQAKVTDTSLANAGTDTQRRTDQYNAMTPEINQLDVKPGGLSTAASARLAADRQNIQNTYNNAGALGLKRIAQHGMGTLTGEQSSLNNSLARGQASDENAAYENGLMSSREDELAALNARMGLQGLYNPNADLGTASSSAERQAQMGSTLGDIGRGITTAASLGSDVVGMGGLSNLPGAIMNGKKG